MGVQKRKCPACRERGGVHLVHGEVLSPDVIARADRGEIVLCGCAIPGKNPDWHCLSCSYRWPGRRTKAKQASAVLFTEPIEGLREFGLPARFRMMEARDMAGRLVPMGVFRGWAGHFLLPPRAINPAF